MYVGRFKSGFNSTLTIIILTPEHGPLDVYSVLSQQNYEIRSVEGQPMNSDCNVLVIVILINLYSSENQSYYRN